MGKHFHQYSLCNYGYIILTYDMNMYYLYLQSRIVGSIITIGMTGSNLKKKLLINISLFLDGIKICGMIATVFQYRTPSPTQN